MSALAPTAAALQDLAARLFQAAGMEAPKAQTVAHILVEADLMGHDTHGLALAPRYLDEITQGAMAVAGEPAVIRDLGACITWDGLRLPGVWLVATALDLALQRVRVHGCVSVAIRNSHHIGCLAAYLSRATEQGCVALITTSDPSQASVAPFGGTQAVFTPNPIAAGIPTPGEPILIDTSASITTNNMAARMGREGRRFATQVLLDAQGVPSDDPTVLKEGGSILPAGGLDHGQKGYGWAVLVEALTQGLSGFGRADHPQGWGASVFLQVLDPQAFAGQGEFTRQTGWLAAACRQNRPRPDVKQVRMPGEAGLLRKRRALDGGLALLPATLEGLAQWCDRLGVAGIDMQAGG